MNTNPTDSGRERVHAPSYPLLLKVIDRLDKAGLPYDVKVRPASIRVDVRPKGGRWELKFTPDGGVEIQRFEAISSVDNDPTRLDDLFRHRSVAD
ncbi:MAG: hypothetical protein ACYDB7_12260 [Mycobacteriales bacterium]